MNGNVIDGNSKARASEREREGERGRERRTNLPEAPISACRSPGSSGRESTSEARRPCQRLGSRSGTQTCMRVRLKR